MVKYILITANIRTYTRATFLPLYFANCNAKLYTTIKNSIFNFSYSTVPHSSLKVKTDSLQISDLNLETLKSDGILRETPSYFNESSHLVPSNKATTICFPADFSVPLIIKATDAKFPAHIDDPYMIDIGQERESAYLMFSKYMKPISPTLDDIEVENLPHEREDSSGLCKVLNPLPNINNQESRGLACELPDCIPSILTYVSDMPVSLAKNPHILCCSPNAVIPPESNSDKELNKPSEEQLAKVYLQLKKQLPSFFVKPLKDYKIYSKDIIFENRINGSRIVGLPAYYRHMICIYIVGHIKFAHVRLDILKITSHPEDSTVRVRWRIIGISSLRSLPMLFSFKAFKLKENIDDKDTWIDGFSTFFVGKDGLVYKHIADKVMPDEEIHLAKNPSLASRLASLMGLSHKAPAPTGAAVTSIGDKPRETFQSLGGFGPVPFSLV